MKDNTTKREPIVISGYINMNGNTTDPDYRYKMPSFDVTILGKGTILNNIDDIAACINHPVELIIKYITSITGSNYIDASNLLTGSHTAEDLNKIILNYIKYLLICPKCKIPETVPKITGKKKNITIILSCAACGSELGINSPNKHIDKGIDNIVKYLTAGNSWPELG